MNPVPEKLTSFRVYNEGNDLVGIADVTLPDVEYMSDTIQGAGIAGEVESPVIGHFKAMSVTLKWRTATQAFTSLAKSQAHHLDIRSSIQQYDAAAGQYRHVPIKIVLKGVPKKTGLGKFEVGTAQENETELEVNYLKVLVDNQDQIEIDKFNFICVIDGTDYLAPVRNNLGLG